jgi:serine/threonine protein kinase/tetratricopeptide (TPR) repeat protein
MTDQSQDIGNIFAEALSKSTPEELAGYLDKQCGSDAQLRAEIESLLASHQNADIFLKGLLVDQDITLESTPTEQPGTVIGRYKLLEKIGEGGMAVVYMAQQEQPIRRKVALKIIKLGMDTKQVIARFEAERQALALMDHPHIAKFLDAGTTEVGRPYFVMELVKGISITDYCDRNQLSIRERVTLFNQVCTAVQHAHQRGIIHRDLKPSNVMVAQQDAVSIPKIIDFGIAKAINQRLTEKTVFTQYAQIIGTPAYMSPEQAEFNDLDVDTRTDIYSLGILLYELLIGAPPFSEEQLRQAGYLEMQRVIREEEPAKPSTRLSTLGATLTEIAKQRHATPELLRKTIQGDLDWIIMKTLEKDRTRRYETTNALTLDLERYLHHEPILAHRPSTVYRLQKYLYRHRTQMGVALAIIILMGTTVTTLTMAYINKERRTEVKRIKEKAEHRETLLQVRESLAQGNRQRALIHVEPILPSEHVGPVARLLYASILVETGPHDQARDALEGLFNEEPNTASAAHAMMARLLWENLPPNDVEGRKVIEGHQRQADALHPEGAEACFLRALTAPTIPEKLSWLDKALDLEPNHYESCRLRALTYQASRRYPSLKEEARVMTALKPDEALGFSLLAYALENMGEYDAALAQMDHALDRVDPDGREHARLINAYCDLLMHMGDYQRVIPLAQKWLAVFPNRDNLYLYIFSAQTALGLYEEAQDLYDQVLAANSTLKIRSQLSQYSGVKSELPQFLGDWSMTHVFDCLETGRPWHHPDRTPHGSAFQAMYDAEETYHALADKARPLVDGFEPSWSPDATQLVFSTGNTGISGIAVYDLASQHTDLLAVPGGAPSWSPDGHTIAFVRDRQVLRLADMTAAGNRDRYLWHDSGEIWLIKPDGTNLQYLCRGTRPAWSQDSRHIVYYSETDHRFYSLALTEQDARPRPIGMDSTEGIPLCVSPDGQHIAYTMGNGLNITDRNTGTSLHHWTGLPMAWGGNWSPSGRNFCLGGLKNFGPHLGLLLFDLETDQVAKVFTGQVTDAAWSADETALAFSLGTPLHRIWVAPLDPNRSTIDVLGSGQTLQQQHTQSILDYTQRIEADPEDPHNYLMRAQYHRFLGNQDAFLADMEQHVTTVHPAAQTNPLEQRFLTLLSTIWRSTPVTLKPPVNTAFYEGQPCTSSNGLELYFTSNRPGGSGNEDLWVVTRATIDDAWGNPTNLGDRINSPNWDGCPCLTEDDLTLYFTSKRSGGFGQCDIWKAHRSTVKDEWGVPVNIGSHINTKADEAFVSVTANGLQMVMGYCFSVPSGSAWERDLWICTRTDVLDDWGPPRNLGPTVNSRTPNDIPRISPDGLMLFFTSERPDGFGFRDLWLTWRTTLDAPWSPPVNLGPTINSPNYDQAAIITPDNTRLYFSSIQPHGYGNFDIWEVKLQ